MAGFGIDFGTTNSVVASYNGREVNSYCDDKLPHPSILWYRGDSKPIVGRKAKNKINELSNVPGNLFINSIKSKIAQQEKLEIFGNPYYTWEIASEIFRFLKEDVSEKDKNVPELKEAVITIPLSFNGEQRRAIRKAAKKAGIFVKNFIHEPFAAVIGYLFSDIEDYNKQYKNFKYKQENILVFDWGGGTLDITLVKLDNGCLNELARVGVSGKSGDYFNEVLMSYVITKFQEEKNISSSGFRLDKGVQSNLLNDVEFAKIRLSEDYITSLNLIEFYENNNNYYDLNIQISRDEFECLIQKDIDDAMNLIDKVLNEARMQASQINHILLIGGTSQIPLLKNKMYQNFGQTKIIELDNADTIIAEGAAIISYYNWQPYLVRPLCIQLCDESHYIVFNAGQILKPETAQKDVVLFCNDNTEGEGRLVITESLGDNRNKVKEIINIPISKFLKNIYNERIFANFQIDKDIILQVSAKGSIENEAVYCDIHDLCYGLRFI